jgi:hypothetical protein
MPRFTGDDFDVDVDDFLYECNDWDIKEIIQYLIENDYISEKQLEVEDGNLTFIEQEFNEMIAKIVDNRLRLTAEEDALLKKIADRF